MVSCQVIIPHLQYYKQYFIFLSNFPTIRTLVSCRNWNIYTDSKTIIHTGTKGNDKLHCIDLSALPLEEQNEPLCLGVQKTLHLWVYLCKQLLEELYFLLN